MASGKFTIKNLSEDELDDVVYIQQQAYVSALWESKDVFSCKLHLYPRGCWIVRKNDNPAAYLFVHPWKLDMVVPLNKKLDFLPVDPDCFYIHDLAVAFPFRRQGIGNQLVNIAFKSARGSHFSSIFLVSVQNTTSFWKKFGFELLEHPNPEIVENLHSYGDDAKPMIARI